MYAVIMAGGGGTRLWPLSRPETPKPFLPLLDERSLLQRTVERIVGHPELPLGPEDIAVVTERRYGPMVRAQVPGVRSSPSRSGATRRPRSPSRPCASSATPNEVMLVLPADAWIDPARDGDLPRGPREGRAHCPGWGVRRRRAAGHARRPGRAPGDRVRLPDPRCRRGRRRSTASRRTRWSGFEEKPDRERAGQLYTQHRRGLERGHLPVAAPRDPRRDRAVHGARDDDRRGLGQRLRV